VQLRQATFWDAPAIAEIWSAGWRDGHLGFVPAELVAAREAGSFRPRAEHRVAATTVAIVGDEIAGFVVVVDAELEQLYVGAKHRGAGVAGRLIAAAEQQIKDAGHSIAWLAVVAGNTRARRFYEKSGWSDNGLFDYPASVDGGSIAVTSHRYVKVL
jgi:GNAT superfamily N-acetyltransferase